MINYIKYFPQRYIIFSHLVEFFGSLSFKIVFEKFRNMWVIIHFKKCIITFSVISAYTNHKVIAKT